MIRKTEFTELLEGLYPVVDLNLFNIPTPGKEMIFSLKDEPRLLFGIVVNTDGKGFNDFTTKFTKYDRLFSLVKQNQAWVGIDVVLKRFVDWNSSHIKSFYKEFHLPDPLRELKMKLDQNAFDEIDDKDIGFPDAAKKNQIKSAIQSFENQLLQQYKLSDEKIEEVKNELKYLSSAVDRLNKRDWKAVANKIIYDLSMNVAANVVVDGAKLIDPSAIAYSIWQLAIEIFKVLPVLP